jgi:two-component system response regulator AtoC
MRALLVDDNPDITELLSKFLNAKGHETIVANDPVDGLEKIKNDHFDIVFLDIQMPELSGLDIIQELEIENILRYQNIIIFSANNFSSSELDNLLKKEGVMACLEKPIQLRDILTVMVR